MKEKDLIMYDKNPMKFEYKIRKMLGDRYHLSVEPDLNFKFKYWSLHRRYENCDNIYWSKDNKPIMTSDNYTIVDLYNFAKEHHKIDTLDVISKFISISIYVVLFIALINAFILKGNKYISIFVLTSNLWLIVLMFIRNKIWNNNYKVDWLESSDNITGKYRTEVKNEK